MQPNNRIKMSICDAENANRSTAIKTILDELSGKLTFCLKLKAEQSKAINSILDGNDVFAVLPTSYGKTLIFQLSVLVAGSKRREPAMAIVICPLLSIIEDQMVEAKDLGMSTVSLGNAPNIEEIKSGKYQLIFGSAENVLDKRLLDALKDSTSHLHNRLVALVIDESHVIEMWTGER